MVKYIPVQEYSDGENISFQATVAREKAGKIKFEVVPIAKPTRCVEVSDDWSPKSKEM